MSEIESNPGCELCGNPAGLPEGTHLCGPCMAGDDPQTEQAALGPSAEEMEVAEEMEQEYSDPWEDLNPRDNECTYCGEKGHDVSDCNQYPDRD